MGDFYGRWADLNGDGEVDDFEKFVALEVLEEDEDDFEEEEDEDDKLMSELEEAGLDYDELSMMDEDERCEALEDAELDPDDYDFD